MKLLLVPAIICLALTACGPESSPEGRMGMKIDNLQKDLDKIASLQQQIDSLKAQQTILANELSTLKSLSHSTR